MTAVRALSVQVPARRTNLVSSLRQPFPGDPPSVSTERELPHELAQLYRREREIALIVYSRGRATATIIQKSLSDPVSNPAVRSMLNRLVAKGVLMRTLVGKKFEYGPALTTSESQSRALKHFAEDFFEGSLAQAMEWLDRQVRAGSLSYVSAKRERIEQVAPLTRPEFPRLAAR